MEKLNDKLNFEELLKEVEEKEKEANKDFVPFGEEKIPEEKDEKIYDINETEVSRFLKNNSVFELVIGVEKDKLLTFVDNSLHIQKNVGYIEMKEMQLMELIKNVDQASFNNAKKTYFPSTDAALMDGTGVKSIISVFIKEETLAVGRKPVSNIVDLARQSTSFEVQKMLSHLKTQNLFNEYIPVPMRKYEATATVQIFINTTVVLLSYLGLTLEEISKTYQFSVNEDNNNYYVLLKKI